MWEHRRNEIEEREERKKSKKSWPKTVSRAETLNLQGRGNFIILGANLTVKKYNRFYYKGVKDNESDSCKVFLFKHGRKRIMDKVRLESRIDTVSGIASRSMS